MAFVMVNRNPAKKNHRKERKTARLNLLSTQIVKIRILYLPSTEQGGPLPVISGVITPISRVISPQANPFIFGHFLGLTV